MTKRIAIITWDSQTVTFYAEQVRGFFGGRAAIETYNVQDGSASRVGKADLYLVSTCAYADYNDARRLLPLGGEIVVIQVTILAESLGRLLAVPRGTRALMVNISQRMVTETMAFFNQIGVNNIEFEPCYPGCPSVPALEFAVTPGESRYVPRSVSTILDIGPRVLSLDTLVETALKLGCDDVLEQESFTAYASTVVGNTYSFNRLFNRSIRLESLFEIFQDILDAGVIGIDAKGMIFAFNKKAEYVTGIRRADALDRSARDIVPFISFEDCCRERREITAHLVNSGGTYINVTVSPVVRSGSLLGAFATVQKFTDEENKQHTLRAQLLHKGHAVKYTFDDIIGESQPIRRSCGLARKMAASGASVLITGESGTGKELFAHAIHAASPRRGFPFVAINCAAIPDSLLESELFGYEDGAFTGARRGGKPGYFEFAHRGTLFLDEIEGMSPLLQLKLLRVIQEKEVLRVGGNRVISVDVRIIAATNENLRKLVDSGTFRRDLYYRLGVLPVELPPLRERGTDVLLLFEHLKKQSGASFTLSSDACECLLNHRWDGNIRELGNCVEYLACLDLPLIAAADMPPGFSASPSVPHAHSSLSVPDGDDRRLLDCLTQAAADAGADFAACRFVLSRLAECGRASRPAGRKKLSQDAIRSGYFVSEQEVRGFLLLFESLGLANIHRGRGGSRITRQGERLAALFESECAR